MRRIFAAFSAIAFFVVTPAVHAGLIDNLIGYWQFNGDGQDSSPENRDLDLVGNPDFAPGLLGQSLDLHANASQYAVRPVNDDEFNFGDADFTIQVWVNLNPGQRSSQNILEKFRGPDGPNWTLIAFPPDDGVGFFCPLCNKNVEFRNAIIPAEVWQQLIVRRNGTSLDLFWNGEATSRAIAIGAFPDTTAPLLFGRRNETDGRGLPLDGKLDEIAIWDRAISDAEILALYNGGRGREIVPEPATWFLGFIGVGVAIVPRLCEAADL